MNQSRGLLLVSVLALLGVALAVFWPWNDAPAGPQSPVPGSANTLEDGTPAGPLTGSNDAPAAGEVRAPARAEMREPAPEAAPTGGSDAKVTLTGRLVQPDGSPVADIEVVHDRSFEDLTAINTTLTGGVARAKTAADGAFALEVAAGRKGFLNVLSSGMVFEQGSERYAVPAVSASEAKHDLGDVVVIEGAVLSGIVQDVVGRPLAGIEVTAHRHTGITLIGPGGSQWQHKTGDDGRFSINGLPAGEYRLVTASAQHQPHDERFELAASEKKIGLVVRLESGATISGRVLDDRGAPITGAKVAAYRNRERGGVSVKSLSRGESTETDAGGYFTLGGLDENAVQVRAWGEDYLPASKANVEVGTTDVVLELKRYGAIEGVLVDDQGNPIAGSDVSVSRQVASSFAEMDFVGRAGVKTAADGTFRIERVRPGKVSVSASGEGHVDATQNGVLVASGETTANVRLVGASGAVIVATVLDADGNPVAGAEVSVVEAGDDNEFSFGGSGMRMRSRNVERRTDAHGGSEVIIDDGMAGPLGKGTTDADGKARIGGLPATNVQVKSSHRKLADSKKARLTLPRTGTVETTLRLRRGGTVAVRVLDSDRVAVPAAKFTVRGPLGGEGSPDTRSASSDAQGNASVGPLPVGSYEAVLQQPARPQTFGSAMVFVGSSSSEFEQSRVTFRVHENETASITLTKPPMTLVTGSVSDASGPVGSASVQLVEKGDGAPPPTSLGSGYSAKSKSDGTFEIADVPPGDYIIRFSRRDALVPMEQNLVLSGQDQVVRHLIIEGGGVKVAVYSDHDGDVLRNAKVTIRRAASGAAPQRREVRMVMISASNDGGGETTEMRTGDQSVKTDEEGVAILEDVPPGKYRLEIEHSRHMDHTTEEIEVTANNMTDAGQVKLQIGGALRVDVVDPAKDRASPALVQVYDADGTEARETEPAMGGSARFNGLPEGKYRVRARALMGGAGANAWSEFVEAEVRKGKTTSARVRLP